MKDEIQTIKEQIEHNKTANYVTLLAATKCVDSAKIDELYDLGITQIGENRVQELLAKYDNVKHPFTWHFIGRLQTNKVKYIVDKVEMIQSVDSEKLALEIDKQCRKIGKIMPVLVEINMGQESDKGGVLPQDALVFCKKIKTLPNLMLNGAMCVFPINAVEELYEKAENLYRKLKQNFENFDVLSMGMSGDYVTAVRCGSTMVRLGSAIFGKRNYERIK